MRWKKIENILFVITIPLLLGMGIEIFLIENLGIGPVEVTLIIGILTAFVSTMNITTTIKQSSKNTFINTITIARKEYMAELRKAVEEFCVTAERNDNDKLKELSYKLKLLMNPADKDNEHLLLSDKNKLKALYLFIHRCCSRFTYPWAWFSVLNCKHYKMCLF